MMKILSIVVPSYNADKYLEQCLSSMDDPRFAGALEVVVVDDGSTDRTAEIAQRYVAKRPEVFSLVQQVNSGHGGAVNTGIDHATGKYLRVVDADDWIHTENAVKLVDHLSDAQQDFVVDERTIVDIASGTQVFQPLPRNAIGAESSMLPTCDTDWLPFMNMHTMSVKLEFLKRSGIRLLEKTFYVDFQFAFEVFASAFDVGFVDIPIYFYRVGNAEQSVDHANYVKRYDDHYRVLKTCIAALENQVHSPGRDDFLQHALMLLVHTQLNIAMIYNPNREAGRRMGMEIMQYLKKADKPLARLTRKRHFVCLMMNMMNVDEEKIARLKSAMRKN